MRRVLSAILLICFGLVAPLQAEPARLCLLENKVLPSTIGACPYEVAEPACCDACDSSGAGNSGEDCCVNLDTLSDTTVPVLLEKLSSPLLLMLSFQENEWQRCADIAVRQETAPLPPPARRTANATRRQAVLRVWTV